MYTSNFSAIFQRETNFLTCCLRTWRTKSVPLKERIRSHEISQIWETTMKLTHMLPLKVYLFTSTGPQLERGTKLKMTELFPFKVLSSVEVASHCNDELSQITYNVSIIVCLALF